MSSFPLPTRHSPLPFMAYLFILCASAANTSAGDLNPPVGPITPTQRTPIGPATTPGDADSTFRITQPGSYYLVGNIAGESGKHGIEINAARVTIDLNGFSIVGVPGALDGIFGSVAANGVAIRNGTLVDWPSNAIDIDATGADGTLIDHLIITGGGTTTPAIDVFFGAIISDCTIDAEGAPAIAVNCCSTIQRCRIGSTSGGPAINAIQNCSVLECHFHNCAAGAIQVESNSTIARNTIAFSGGGDTIRVIAGCVIKDNLISAGGTANIHATSTGNRIEANTIISGTRGIDVDSTGNVIVRSSVRDAATPYDIVAGNMTGPIITPANIATNTNPDANYAP